MISILPLLLLLTHSAVLAKLPDSLDATISGISKPISDAIYKIAERIEAAQSAQNLTNSTNASIATVTTPLVTPTPTNTTLKAVVSTLTTVSKVLDSLPG